MYIPSCETHGTYPPSLPPPLIVVDDDDSDVITASSVVTLSVSLSRQSLQEAYNLGTTVQTITPEKGQEVEPHTVPMCVALGMLSPPQDGADGADLEEREEEKEQTHNGLPPNNVAKKPKKPVVSAKKKQSKVRRRTLNPKKVKKSDRTMAARLEECSDEGEGEVEGRGRKGDVKGKVVSGGREDSASGSSEGEGEGEGQHKDEEEEWNRLQKSLQKHSKKKFEPKATDSHPVHAPYFPEVCMYTPPTSLRYVCTRPYFPEVRMYTSPTSLRYVCTRPYFPEVCMYTPPTSLRYVCTRPYFPEVCMYTPPTSLRYVCTRPLLP